MKDFQDWPWWLQCLVYLPLALALRFAFVYIANTLDPDFSEKAAAYDAWRGTDQ